MLVLVFSELESDTLIVELLAVVLVSVPLTLFEFDELSEFSTEVVTEFEFATEVVPAFEIAVELPLLSLVVTLC